MLRSGKGYRPLMTHLCEAGPPGDGDLQNLVGSQRKEQAGRQLSVSIGDCAATPADSDVVRWETVHGNDAVECDHCGSSLEVPMLSRDTKITSKEVRRRRFRVL